MIQQFNATYRVTVFSNKETTIVEYPLTCKFTVTRGVLSDSNRATIQLYNLGLSTRNQIFQDQLTLDQSKFKYVHLEAGYNDNLSLIFKGRILQAYSFKSGGQTDIITEIQATALDIFDRQTSHTFEAGTTFKEAHNRMASDMPNVIVGNIGNLNGEFKTPTTFDGMAIEQLNKLTGGHTFVDNGVLNTIMDNEVIDVPVPIISNQSNLLETPMRRDANLEIKTTFLPDIIVGQLVEVDSSISPNFNGQFKLVGFTHDCLISPTIAGRRTTQMTLWIGPMLPSANLNLSQQKKQQFSKVKGEDSTPVAINEPADVRGVYNYIKNNNGKIPNKKITRNISWKEMIGNDNTNSERYNELSIVKLSNVYSIANTFQRVLDRYFPGRTVKINSGWRSTNNNSHWNGNPKSKHLSGLAIDFRIPGLPTNQVFDIFKSIWNGKILYYAKGDFIHIQQASSNGYINDV